MSAISDAKVAVRDAADTALTALEGDGSNLSPTQQDAIAGRQAAIEAEEASAFDADDSRDQKQSVGYELPYGLRTAPIANVPVISSALTGSGTQGAALTTYNITGSNTPTSYSATGLPAGLSINTSTGAITGTPTVAGTFTVRIGATNAHGTGYANLVLTLASGAPAVTSSLTASGTHSVAFSYTITGSNTPTSFAASGLPSGLTLNTSTGAITGTLGAGTAGVANVTITATNAYGSGSADLVITIG